VDPESEEKEMGRTFTRTEYHVIFDTTRRTPSISREVRAALYRVMAEVVVSRGGRVHGIGGTDNHVHLDVEIPVAQKVSDMVAAIKATSSGWMRRRGGNPAFRWQRGYAALSVSPSLRNRLLTYIDTQEDRHRNLSAWDELQILLKKHGMEVPTYLLEDGE
jgi:putative transposase